MAATNQPIVIKRVKKHAHGHHGGAWKVAFADFVTAMMAFFMLMWLMGSTTPEQKAAISDFFEHPSAVPAQGGGSTSFIDLGGSAPEAPSGNGDGIGHLRDEAVATADDDKFTFDQETIDALAQEQEQARMESLRQALQQAIASAGALQPFKDQLLLDITSEGLRIQIVDQENRPMFAKGSAVLHPYTQDILREIAKVINQVPNKISLSGHTDKTPFVSDTGYSNWELSADRANAARRELVAAGMNEDRMGRVVGLSSSVPFDRANPFNPNNRRISIIVMNQQTAENMDQSEGQAGPPADAPAVGPRIDAHANAAAGGS